MVDSFQEPLDWGLSWNTEPQPSIPTLVPYRFPSASKARSVCGGPSLSFANAYKILSFQPPWAFGPNLKTVPYPSLLPPATVVPYRLPALSKITPASGNAPSLPDRKL